MPRIQAPDFQYRPTLRPAPIPREQFIAPPRPIIDNRLSDLASALSSFSGSIGRFAASQKPAQEDKQAQAWAAEKKIMGMTRDETAKLVEGGHLPTYKNEWENRASQAAAGHVYGGHRADQLRQDMIENFDWDGGDVDEYLSGAIKGDLEKYGADPNFGPKFLSQVDQTRQWAIQYRDKWKTEQHETMKSDAAFGVMNSDFGDMIEQKVSPADAAQKLFKGYETLGKNAPLGVNFEKLDDEAVNLAARIVDTNPEYAIAILETKRPGNEQGQGAGSLADKSKYQAQVETIRQQAAKARATLVEQETRQMVLQNDVAALQNGELDTLSDQEVIGRNGRETIKADDRRKAAVKDYLKSSEGQSTANRETNTTRWARELYTLTKNGEKHPGIESRLIGLASRYSPSVNNDPEAKKDIIDRLNMYGWLKGQSATQLAAHTKEEDRRFADLYFMAQSELGLDQDRALDWAYTVETSPAGQGAMSSINRLGKEVDSAVKDVTSGGWFSKDNAANFTAVRTRVYSMAVQMATNGMEPEQAIKLAAKQVKESSVSYHGTLLNMSGAALPDNWEVGVDKHVEQYLQSGSGKVSGLEADDITIREYPGRGFRLIEKDTLQPITDDNGKMIEISFGSIRNALKADMEKGVAEKQTLLKNKSKDAAITQEAKQNGWMNPFGMRDFWYDPKTGHRHRGNVGADGKIEWTTTRQNFWGGEVPIRETDEKSATDPVATPYSNRRKRVIFGERN